MEIQVVQITVLVADMDDSIRFYRDRLGLGLATKQLNDLHSRPSFSSHALRANRLEPTRAIGVNPCARRACALNAVFHELINCQSLTPVEVSPHWSEFEAGPVHIALHPGRTGTDSMLEGGTDAGTVNIVLHVPDLEAGCQSLRARGVDVNGPFEMEVLPPLARFNDPDGISFTLTARSNS